MTDPFSHLEPPAHLSGRRISLAALDELDVHERAIVAAHLATCGVCRGRIEQERLAIAVASTEVVPSIQRKAPPDLASFAGRSMGAKVIPFGARSRRTHVVVATFGALAVAAAVFLVARPTATDPVYEPEHVRAKGLPTVEVAIQRDGAMLGEPTAIANAPALLPDDKLRLRLGRAAGVYAVVEGFDAGAWVDLYRGAIPEDGWLPMGVVVTAGDPARLRVQVCPHELVAGATNECTTIEHTFSQ